LVEATGQQIVDALEMSARNYPNENGGFLQVSGLTYNINPSTVSTVKVDSKGMFASVDGARRVENVKVLDANIGQYVPIDLAKTYKLASHNYMLKSGGDGLNMFMKDKILLDEVKLDNQVLIDYIKDSLSGVVGTQYANLAGQGRITVCEHNNGGKIVNQKAATCASEGYTGDLVCADCGYLMSPGIQTPPTGNHNYEDGVCTVCGYSNNYSVTNDANTQTVYKVGSAQAVSVHIECSLDKFIGVKMDGTWVAPENITLRTGSTIVTFKPEYLKTLSPGKHTATVIFTDGTATAELTVNDAASSAVSPATGDSSNVVVYTLLGLTALLGTGIVVGRKKELF